VVTVGMDKVGAAVVVVEQVELEQVLLEIMVDQVVQD